MSYPIYFVGAGPGDPELITLKAKKLIDEAELIVYAGSLVPASLFEESKAKEIVNSAPLTLEQIIALLERGYKEGKRVVRVHTGDPSLYGTIREQTRVLAEKNIPYEIVPGISAAFALAARAKVSFTSPEANQTLILTRVSGKTKVPEEQDLERLAQSKSSLAIYLSATKATEIQKKLLQAGYPEDSLVVIGYRVGWPDEKIIYSNLKNLLQDYKLFKQKRQILFLVIPKQELLNSCLYSAEFSHLFRK
ncbi:MAG: Cobalt-precorrin-4 C(11)-methyltransferase [Desulfonauticus sp. 38_4375]|nr:MAG: Cobalt-precorrin-4 C(11)-methyltransferase [Desulfonauticus sp. 38_4375]